MSLDYQDVYARSRDVPAFANSDEGDAFTAAWCERCLRDAPFRSMGTGTGCPIIMVTLVDRTPAEFLDGPRDEQGRYSMSQQYTCVEFRPRGGGGGEPRPKPEPPDMDGLFPRPERQTRMPVLPETRPVTAERVEVGQ